MKKRIVSLLLCVAMLLTLLPQTALFASAATSGTCGENLTWELDRATGELTIEGTGRMENYSIPYFPLTDEYYSFAHYAPWYKYREEITRVSVGPGVTYIGRYAFYGCLNLKDFPIPAGVTGIGTDVFSGSGLVKDLPYEDGVRYFDCWLIDTDKTVSGEYAIREGTTLIADFAFGGDEGEMEEGNYDWIPPCDKLTGIRIPDSVKAIGAGAFSACGKLARVTIGTGLERVGSSAFKYCDRLTDVFYAGTEEDWKKISVSEDNEPLLNAALHFETDHPVYSGTCGENLTWTLDTGTGLLTISGTGPMENIWNTNKAWNAYRNVIKQVFITDGVTAIGEGAFENCDNLKVITVPASVTEVGDYAFFGCEGITDVYFGGTLGAWCALEPDRSEHDSLEDWPYGAVIHADAVPGEKLEGVCGKNLTWTLDLYTGSLNISGTGDMEDYSIFYLEYGSDNLRYNSAAPWYPHRKLVRSVTVEEGVTGVGSYAFCLCPALTEITLPDTLERFGFYALEDTAFLNDKANRTDGVLYVDHCLIQADRAISGTYEVADGTVLIADFAFGGEELPPGDGPYYLPCDNLTGITLPDSVTHIGESAFLGCKALADVRLGSGVTRIGADAFRNCDGLCDVYYAGTEAQWNDVGIDNGNECLTRADIHFESVPSDMDACTHKNRQNVPEQPATCTEPGREAGVWCPDCETWLEGGEKIPAGHVDGDGDGFCDRCREDLREDPCEGFTDVPPVGNWARAGIEFCVCRGIMGSTSKDVLTFEPNTLVSRAMVASILYRMADSPAVEYKATFTDVPADKWFTSAIEWCAQNGLASGKGNGKFDPNGNVTRQELAVFMMKMAEYLGEDTSGRADLGIFADAAKVPAWAKTYLEWAVDAGLISGKANGGKTYLAPTDTATRAEFASIIMRFVQNIAEAK